MRILFLLTILAMPLALTACKTTVEGDDGRIVVDGDRYDGGYGNHCPPGHAKKGWC